MNVPIRFRLVGFLTLTLFPALLPTMGAHASGADTTPPSITITSGPTGTLWNVPTVDFAWLASDQAPSAGCCTYSYQLTGPYDATDYPGSGGWVTDLTAAYSNLEDGPYTFTVRARDAAGNVSAPVIQTFYVLTDSCELPGGAYCDTTYDNNVGLNVPTVYDFGVADPSCLSVTVTWDDGSTQVVPPTPDPDGTVSFIATHTYTTDVGEIANLFLAQAASGCTFREHVSYVLGVLQPTSVSVPTPVNGQNGWFDSADVSPVPVSVTANAATDLSTFGAQMAGLHCTDNGNPVSVSELSLGGTTVAGTVQVQGDGIHTVTCYSFANDADATQVTWPSTVTINIDTQHPQAAIVSGPVASLSAATFEWTGSDPAPSSGCCTYAYELTGPGQTGGYSPFAAAGSTSYGNLAPGTYTFSVEAQDTAGNLSVPASQTFTVYAPLASGTFVLGDQSVATAGSTGIVTWWGGNWASVNVLSGGAAPASFKGFADTVLPGTLTCGDAFQARPGNSGSPPAQVPSLMPVVVTSNVTKSGNTISGTVVKVVLVKTIPGYGNDPGHAGTGTVVATLCG